MTLSVKVSKATLGLAIAITSAVTAFSTSIVQYEVHDPVISGATALLMAGVSGPVVAFLTTEEATAPA